MKARKASAQAPRLDSRRLSGLAHLQNSEVGAHLPHELFVVPLAREGPIEAELTTLESDHRVGRVDVEGLLALHRARHGAKRLEDRRAVEPRHVVVDEDEIAGRQMASIADELGGGDDFVALRDERALDAGEHHGAVVDDQDLARLLHVPTCARGVGLVKMTKRESLPSTRSNAIE